MPENGKTTGQGDHSGAAQVSVRQNHLKPKWMPAHTCRPRSSTAPSKRQVKTKPTREPALERLTRLDGGLHIRDRAHQSRKSERRTNLHGASSIGSRRLREERAQERTPKRVNETAALRFHREPLRRSVVRLVESTEEPALSAYVVADLTQEVAPDEATEHDDKREGCK